MNIHESFAHEDMASRPTAPARSSWLRLLRARLAAWVTDCADCYAAAAAYDDLSRLSDVELKHRELSRDILARDLSQGRDRSPDQSTDRF